jgi:hypothetical protein
LVAHKDFPEETHVNETETTTAEPTTAQMRAYLRANRPDLNVGVRGFLSAAAVKAYREAHGLPVED